MKGSIIRPIQIGHRLVGPGQPCFIIAEAGVNHNGNIELAHRLVDLAADCGVDAIKFQTFVTDNVESKHSLKPAYFSLRESTKSKRDFSLSIELTASEFLSLKAHTEEREMVFLSTACDTMALGILLDIGVSALKIGSSDTNNFPLLREAARTKLPIILSTGISTSKDVEDSVNELHSQNCSDIVVLQCTSNYPIAPNEANVRVIPEWMGSLCVPIGFSDHTEGISVACAAVALGACVIEKHFTISRLLPGVDHPASLEPAMMKQMVDGIRAAEQALGQSVKVIQSIEAEHLLTMRKSLVAASNLSAGHVLCPADILVKRPGGGVEPSRIDHVVGRRLKVDVQFDDLLKWEHLE